MRRMVSEHFSLEEMTFSETAARLGLDNTPPSAALKNLRRLCETLDVVRAELGNHSIRVTSGYRSPQVNKAIGGSENSAHTRGLAADFVVPSYGTVLATARAVSECGIEYDQIIFEFGKWIHLAIPPLNQVARMELYTTGSSYQYVPGLHVA